MSRPAIDLESMTTDECLRLLEEVWESLRQRPTNVPLTDAQREELDRRLDDLDREGPVGIPWEEVQRRIVGRQE